MTPLPDRFDLDIFWNVGDPEGFQIEVAAWGLPEHLAQNCKGSPDTCPAGESA